MSAAVAVAPTPMDVDASSIPASDVMERRNKRDDSQLPWVEKYRPKKYVDDPNKILDTLFVVYRNGRTRSFLLVSNNNRFSFLSFFLKNHTQTGRFGGPYGYYQYFDQFD